MHLTDDQLLELTQNDKEHLAQCEACNQRALNLISMRNKMHLQPIIPDLTTNWSALKQVHQKQQQLILVKQVQQKVIFWRFSSLALAASIAAIAFWPQLTIQPTQNSYQSEQIVLTNWIEQNNQIQQQLALQLNDNLLSRDSFNQLQVQLNVIDESLQQAYLTNSSVNKKLELWQQRKQLVENSLLINKDSHIISI